MKITGTFTITGTATPRLGAKHRRWLAQDLREEVIRGSRKAMANVLLKAKCTGFDLTIDGEIEVAR